MKGGVKMYFEWEIAALIDDSSDIEGLYEDNGKLHIQIYPRRFRIPMADFKVIIHPAMGGKYHPMYNENENIMFFSTEAQLAQKSNSREWEIPDDFLYQFITEVIEEKEVAAETVVVIQEPVFITDYPPANLMTPLPIFHIPNKDIGVATKSNLGI
jgi:hypothetical protein